MSTSRRQSDRYCIAMYVTLAAAAAMLLQPAAARAQCVGDCDGDGKVSITELIIGVNIVLGGQPASTCPAFQDGSGTVSISQLVKGVNNALGSCPVVPTATATVAPSTPTKTAAVAGTPTDTRGPVDTPTSTPTLGPTGTPTPCPMVAVCGDGCIEPGETCDDGNTMDGDDCPSTCFIATCQSTIPPLIQNVDVSVQAPDGTIGALTVFLRYPESAIFLPGSGPAASNVITNLPDDAFNPVENDVDYGVRVVAVGPGGLTLGDSNRFFTAEFTRCKEAGLPVAADFTCTVEEADVLDLDTGNSTNVTSQTHCSVAVR